ncbi:GrpB family protein [Pseudomonas mosselii]|uniref:GrpB family protein n=1 Tax=Pseudomonas mosselii TaxID=78327 RepID=A0ABX9AVP2_9PSED|nr:GrpB family protein [Pseudomonas mosselii]MBC3456489.1 GrpB family protein [Pseudomonas mosselii]MBH3308223.1 GrpB family protein [Pseudomonas mosselii]MBH3324530.1 GrpB family protein [Pseudomonas mosselii]MCL8301719.1 GrpB family protein [Pseudomonas mosselii]MCL8340231.1 GrpB family protein [Pseudomonas mosselii]
MALTSKITTYNPEWPQRYEADKMLLVSAFGDELIAMHHVGSTAVPQLAAKPEIDVLIEVSEHCNAAARDEVLLSLGYVRGSDLSEGHHFYRRNIGEVRTHKVHICRCGHPSIIQMLTFRELLRNDASLRQRYQDLKIELEATNTGGMAEYLEKKGPFIITALLEVGIRR